MDPISLDAKAQQSLNGGEDIGAVSVDNSIIWKEMFSLSFQNESSV